MKERPPFQKLTTVEQENAKLTAAQRLTFEYMEINGIPKLVDVEEENYGG